MNDKEPDDCFNAARGCVFGITLAAVFWILLYYIYHVIRYGTP